MRVIDCDAIVLVQVHHASTFHGNDKGALLLDLQKAKQSLKKYSQSEDTLLHGAKHFEQYTPYFLKDVGSLKLVSIFYFILLILSKAYNPKYFSVTGSWENETSIVYLQVYHPATRSLKIKRYGQLISYVIFGGYNKM